MSQNVKEYSEFKKRALLAKQRMRMGYWQAVKEEKSIVTSESCADFDAAKRARELQLARIGRDIDKTLCGEKALRDEKMYQKVCEILDKDEDVLNPIGLLVEHEIYDKMDEANKQRYILELSKEFIRMRDRYYTERAVKSC